MPSERPNRPDPKPPGPNRNASDSFWSEFRDLCRDLAGLCPIPFRIEDREERIIYETEPSPDQAADTTLTMECREQGQPLFRIVCATDDAGREQVLHVMFALRRLGRFYRTSAQGREFLYEEIGKNYRFLHFFYTLPALLSRDVHRDRLCQVGLDRICKILNVERGSIFLYHATHRSFRLVALHGQAFFPLESAVINPRILEALRDKDRPLLVENIDHHPDLKGKGDYRTGSFLSAPVYFHPSVHEARLAGVINLADPVGRPAFTSHDLKFASSAAAYSVFLAMTKPEPRPRT